MDCDIRYVDSKKLLLSIHDSSSLIKVQFIWRKIFTAAAYHIRQ